MDSNYTAIIQKNTRQLFTMDLDERAAALLAQRRNLSLAFEAFGKPCTVSPKGIALDGIEQTGPMGIVISLYTLQAGAGACVLEPFKSFKELPDSMPYVGAFTNRTEQCLIPIVERLTAARQQIITALNGGNAPAHISGDLCFVVRPLPKIALCYACYGADEDFPAAVTCLYSHNADQFLSTDALADLGEFTSKTIKELVE